MLLPAANGTLDLRTAELRPHCREDRITRLVPIDVDPEARCPTWEAFVARVLPDEEVRSFVQRLAGYSLTGSTAEQILIFLYGQGRNGKSVFMETLADILGGYHTATRIQTLSSTGGAIPNDVAALAGARMVTVSETPEGSRLNESLVKDLTGGDTITARFLRREFFQFRPQFKLWVRGNHKPQIRGTDDGIWRRVMLIPFAVQIPEHEVDARLAEKLNQELPGILQWALRGCLDWQSVGLCAPTSVEAAVNAYRREMDLLGEFIRDCCCVSEGLSASASSIGLAYGTWCKQNGYEPMTATALGKALGQRGFRKEKRGTVRWIGLQLRA